MYMRYLGGGVGHTATTPAEERTDEDVEMEEEDDWEGQDPTIGIGDEMAEECSDSEPEGSQTDAGDDEGNDSDLGPDDGEGEEFSEEDEYANY
jgi:hypothetical protein